MNKKRPGRSLFIAYSLSFIAFVCIVLYVCLFFSAFSAFAQTTNDNSPPSNLHQWGAVTLFHGLPSDRVRALAQDADGFMWFGTDNGLARYDGRRTQTVAITGLAAANGTNATRVLALQVDAEGALWAGTDAGAARWANGEWRVVEATRDKAVTAILMAERGRAWLATNAGVVFDCAVGADNGIEARALPGGEALRSADADQPGALALTSLARDADGALVVGSRSRALLRAEGDALREINSRPRLYFVEALARDAGGALWFGGRARGDDSGLYEARNLARPAKIGAGLGTVTAIQADAAGAVWVGTDARGAWRFRDRSVLEHFTFAGTAGGLRSDHVYAIFTDREGVVWFGTDRGVCRYDPRSPHSETIGDDAESNFVRVLDRTRAGELLCGTNRGLFVSGVGGAGWQPIAALARKSIYALNEDAAGRLLVGTSSGLYAGADATTRHLAAQLDQAVRRGDEAATRTTRDAPATGDQNGVANVGTNAESVRAVRVFRGAIYVASFGRGVEQAEGNGRRVHLWPGAAADASLREVTALYTDGKARLWIGTARAGVFVYEGGQVRAAPDELQLLRGAPVWAMDGHGDGGGDHDALWFATGRGLYVWRAGKLSAAVPNVDARAVVADVDEANADAASVPRAWCAAAGAGLLRVALDAELGTLVSRLEVEQGLPSASAFALLRVDTDESIADAYRAGTAWLIGTNRGLVRYAPGASFPSLVATRVLSRRLHQPEELRAGIELPYPQNSLALDVAALGSRTYPEQFLYSFAVRDANGRVVQRKLAHDAAFLMENLKPGAYAVEVCAFTQDLVPSAPLKFAFAVGRAPFPWTTALLGALLASALVALGWGTWQNRRRARAGDALIAAHHELAGARLNLANEAERERRRIARDLHDQTLADLRSLLLLTDRLPTHAVAATLPTGTATPSTDTNDSSETQSTTHARETIEPAMFRAEIEAVSQEIRRICEDLSPSVLDNVGLAAALEWALTNAVAHLPPARKFASEFACDEALDDRLRLAPGVRMQLYRITQEAINNVCRHAEATRVRLAVSLSSSGEFLLTLADDGRGFDAHDRRAYQRGRGLGQISDRASLIEAHVAWQPNPGGGTIFVLRKTDAAGVSDEPLTTAN